MSKAGIAILILILAVGGVGLIMLYLSPPIRPSTGVHTANSDGSNPGYPFWLLDKPGNFWDRCNWWQKVLVVCAAVILCGLVGGMAASHLVGPK